jgi:ACS family hexuronate transporter-like MFS transporter
MINRSSLAAEPSAEVSLSRADSWKWWLTIILFLATVLTYLDRQTLSLCAPLIADEFKLSNEQYGQLVAAFRWAYAFTHVPAGWLADHLSVRLLYALAVGVWSLAGAAGALVQSARQLFGTRLVLGIGEASNWPCASRVVANILPSTDRGLGSGIFNSGAAVGSLIAPLIITPIAVRLGWRWAFFVLGAAGMFWIALWLVVTRRDTRAHAASQSQRHRKADSAMRGVKVNPDLSAAKAQHQVGWAGAIFAQPAFWMLLVVALTVNPCWYFLNEWIPKYMHDMRGLGYMAAGMVTVPIFIGADLGNLLSGGSIKLLTRHGWSLRRARGVTLTAAAALIVPVALITHTQAPAIAVMLLGLAGFGVTSIVANYTACMQDFSFTHVGLVAGLNGMVSNICAAVVNPYIGRYVDFTGNYTLIFLLMALLPIVSVLAVVAFDSLVRVAEN